MIKCIDTEFQTNANQTGIQTFRMITQGLLENGRHAYIYQRTRQDQTIFGFEVFIPTIKKAGTYPLPGGKTITYNEDFEEYPGASKFGISAWFYPTLGMAEKRYNELMEVAPEIPDELETPADPGLPVVSESVAVNSGVPRGRGRPKVDRPPLSLPAGEFSCKELAASNSVDYPVAFLFLKEQEAAELVKRTRTERRAVKGPETQLFSKV